MRPAARGTTASPFLLASLLVIAAVIRAGGAMDGFWLDEIWSYNLSLETTSALEVLTKLRIDNNHPLNTLMMWLLGDRAVWQVYRIPVVVCSTATVALAWWWGSSRSPAAGALSAGALAVSFPMVVYGSEARGYAYAGFFLLASLICLDRRHRGVGWTAAYVIAAVGGTVSHPTFLPALGAVLVWDVVRRGLSPGTAAIHMIPIAAAGAFWLTFVRGMEIGGSGQVNPFEGLVATIRLATAYPIGGDASVVVAIAGLLAAAASIGVLLHRRDDRWLLYLLGIFVLPATGVIVQSTASAVPVNFIPRYFFLPMMLLLLLWADMLATWASGRRRVEVFLLRTAFGGVNLLADARFLRYGRGDFEKVLGLVESRSPPGEITVACDNDFRGRTMVEFYARYRLPGRSIRYVQSIDPADLPQWMLVHLADASAHAAPELGGAGLRYSLAGVQRHYGPSGFTWAAYQRR